PAALRLSGNSPRARSGDGAAARGACWISTTALAGCASALSPFQERQLIPLAQVSKGSHFCPDNIFRPNGPRLSRNSMRTDNEQHVIIVSAGAVGLVPANLLVDEGIAVSLVETCDDLPRDLRASTFHPPTLDMLERFGVVERMIEQGVICSTREFLARRRG